MENFIGPAPKYSTQEIKKVKIVDSLELRKRESRNVRHSLGYIGSEFIPVENSNPALRTVGIVNRGPFKSNLKWGNEIKSSRVKHLDMDQQKADEIIVIEPSHEDKRMGIINLQNEEKKMYSRDYSKQNVTERKSQVRFTESKLALRSLERVEEILSFQEGSNTSANKMPKVQSLSLIKERPSSDSADILQVSENIISVDVRHQIRVKTSSENKLEGWEVESGFAIFKSLNPIPYSPKFKIAPQSSDISYERRLKVLQKRKKCKGFLGSEECMEYLGPIEFSELFVTNTIEQAKETYLSQIHQYGDPDKKPSRIIQPPHITARFWTSIKHLSREEGLFLIEKYIVNDSNFEEDWKYTIFFNGIQSDKVSDHYFYVAKFCLPTKLYPIAQVTVSLHFHMETSRIIPPQCPIKVRFTIEGSHFEINPDKCYLNDKMLFRVLDIKLKIFKSCTI